MNNTNAMEKASLLSAAFVSFWGFATQNALGLAGFAVGVFTALIGWYFKRQDNRRAAERRAEERHLAELRAQELQARIAYMRTGRQPPLPDSDLAALVSSSAACEPPANDEPGMERA